MGTRVTDDFRQKVDLLGPSDIVAMGQYPNNMDHDAPGSPESLLVGGPVQETKKMARKASTTTCVTLDIFAGDKYKMGRKASWYVVTY